jgi:hypothetical protein
VTQFSFNGVELEEEAFLGALYEAQEHMIAAETQIRVDYGVSRNTASAIFYLRGRSRWTLEKELELVDRDHAGNPISLGSVLSGEF